jgi:hypothetical protein
VSARVPPAVAPNDATCVAVPTRFHTAMRPPLLGTYTPPAVRKGERVTCLYRDPDCVVTGWHDGRIPWPSCQPGSTGAARACG